MVYLYEEILFNHKEELSLETYYLMDELQNKYWANWKKPNAKLYDSKYDIMQRHAVDSCVAGGWEEWAPTGHVHRMVWEWLWQHFHNSKNY